MLEGETENRECNVAGNVSITQLLLQLHFHFIITEFVLIDFICTAMFVN